MGLDPATMMIGSQVIGGLMGSDAASSAADAQSNAANQATQAQLQMYNTGVQLESPFRQFGTGGMNKLAYLMGISPNGYSSADQNAQIGPNGVLGAGSSPTGTAAPAATIPQAGVTQPQGTTETAAQIRQRLAPQFASRLSDAYDGTQMNADLNAAVQQELARQQQASQVHASTGGLPASQASTPSVVSPTGQPAAGSPAATDPAYGSLLRNFGPQDFQLDPGIQFQLKYGQQALQNSQAAKSGALSGEALKGLIGFNQDYAGLGYQSAFDRYNANRNFTLGSLMDVARLGQAAASNTVNSGSSYASGIANTMTGAGNAQAAGIIGSTNALSGGLTGAGNAYLLRNLLPSSAGAASGVPANPYVLSGNPMAYAG